MGLDPEAPEPLYRQLAGLLEDKIRSGGIPPRRRLPSIRDLTQEYGVAQKTAENALRVLRERGLAETIIGKGVYTTEPANWPPPR